MSYEYQCSKLISFELRVLVYLFLVFGVFVLHFIYTERKKKRIFTLIVICIKDVLI